MSVDNRLREALDRSATQFVPRGGDAVDAVVGAARRRRTTRRVAAGAVAALALTVVAVPLWDRAQDTSAPTVPAGTVTPTSSPSAEPPPAAGDAALAAAIRGTWMTPVVTPELAAAAMARTGTLGYRDAVMADLRLPGILTLTFDELSYRATLHGQSVDEGTWYVRGGRLVLLPLCTTANCRTVLQPDLTGDALRLLLVEDTSPDVDRVPQAAFTTVLYTAAPLRHS